MDTLFQRPDQVLKGCGQHHPLYVVTVIFNPVRFRSRWKLYLDFAKRVEQAGAILYTVECAFGDREFVVTDPNNPRHIQVRTQHELWLKECLGNLAVQRLPPDWQNVAFVDADFSFARDDWANETIQQLQHYQVVQMFSQWIMLSPDSESLGIGKSLTELYLHHRVKPCEEYPYGQVRGHALPGAPGGATAYRREAWDALGGMIDWAILGSADGYMAHALFGQLDSVLSKRFHPRYREMMFEWQARAERSIRRNVGVVKGLALHHWHGSHKRRGYSTRNNILFEHQFNPDIDLKRDWQGLYQLTGRSTELRDDIRCYFRSRNEDSIEV